MFKLAIVTPATPDWAEAVTSAAKEQFSYSEYGDRASYMARLVDEGAAMIVIDADALDDWRWWVVTPKISPATRRIPIVVVTEDAHNYESALQQGADFHLRPAELAAELPELLAAHARIISAEFISRLEVQCSEPLPPEGLEGIRRFNAGEYYKQHDLFEALWVKETGPVRDLYRAILQVGVAYFQITRGNRRGALKMLMRSVQWLSMLPDECRGVDIKQLREDSYRVRAELERVPDIADFDMTLLRPVKLHEK